LRCYEEDMSRAFRPGKTDVWEREKVFFFCLQAIHV
jgi:hypothetical protein